jgi:hypothetical protein
MLAPAPLAPPPPDQVPPPMVAPPGTSLREGRFSLGLAYNVGIPVGSVHDFTSKVSGVGFEFLDKFWLSEQLTLGIGIDWQTFTDDKPRTTYPIENGAVTATAYNSVQQAAIRAGADYYIATGGALEPFIGLNAGFAWSTFQTSAADIALYDDQESFIVGGELGALFSVPQGPMLFLTGRYSYQPSAEFLSSVTDLQAVTIQIGAMSR